MFNVSIIFIGKLTNCLTFHLVYKIITNISMTHYLVGHKESRVETNTELTDKIAHLFRTASILKY